MVRQAAPRGLGKHCHCCRQKRATSQLIPCGASQGDGGAKHGPWCHRCILTKLHKNAAFIEAASAAAELGTWRCPRCDDVCPCNKCIQRRSKEGKQRKQGRHVSCSDDEDHHLNELMETSTDHDLDCFEGKDRQQLRSRFSGLDDSDVEGCSPEPSPRACGVSKKASEPPANGSRLLPQRSSVKASCISALQDIEARPEVLSAHTLPSATRVYNVLHMPAHPPPGTLRPKPIRLSPPRYMNYVLGAAAALDSDEDEPSAGVSDRFGERVVESNDGSEPAAQTRKGRRKPLLHQVVQAASEERFDDSVMDRDGQAEAAGAGEERCPSGSDGSFLKSYKKHLGRSSSPWSAAGVGGRPCSRLPRTSSGKEECESELDVEWGPKTPSAFDIVKRMPLQSPGHRNAGLHSEALPLRKRLGRKGIPSRGDSGCDFKDDDVASALAESGGRGKDDADEKAVAALPASPDISFEALESARGAQDEDEGVVSSFKPMCIKDESSVRGGSKSSRANLGASAGVRFRPCERVGSFFQPLYSCTDRQSPPARSTIVDDGPQPCETWDRKRGYSSAADPLKNKRKRSKRSCVVNSLVVNGPKAARAAGEGYCGEDISYEPPSPSQSTDSVASKRSSGAGAMKPVLLQASGNKAGNAQDSDGAGATGVAWTPPESPYGLIQEKLYSDPWKLLVACMLLNKSSGEQIYRVIWDLFDLIPGPKSAIEAEADDIAAIIHSLGLHNKRAALIQRFSKAFLYSDWADVTELPGVGKYAADAYAIFCEGRWRTVEPEDSLLRTYREWLRRVYKQEHNRQCH